MKTSIKEYEDCFAVAGSDAVWTRVNDRCLTDAERRDEVDEIEAHGWFVKRHFDSDRTGEMDDVAFAPPLKVAATLLATRG